MCQVRQRQLPTENVQYWRERIAAMEEDLQKVIGEERAERERIRERDTELTERKRGNMSVCLYFSLSPFIYLF